MSDPAAWLLAAEGGGGAAGPPIAVPLWVWGVFVAFVSLLLIVDLKVVMGKAHRISIREAAWYSAGWITLGIAFMGVVWWAWGSSNATEYITGYLIEKSLSIDNVFVWSVLFSFFAVRQEYQHRVLFWGIFGALVMRAAFIFAGAALLRNFTWIIYVFGAFLLYTAYRIATSGGEIGVDPEHNPVIQRVRRVLPQTEGYREEHFLVRESGRWMVTPLLTVLISIELTDVLFAVDSIPAILAITQDEFLVFSSNAFAILGLRALYFLLAGVKDRFVYLDRGLGVVLGFVGVKFILEGFDVHIPVGYSLGFIAVVLTITIWLSWRRSAPTAEGGVSPAGHDTGRLAASEAVGDRPHQEGDDHHGTGSPPLQAPAGDDPATRTDGDAP